MQCLHLLLMRLRRIRLARHEGGNVAILFGLMIVPLLGAIGLVVDYGNLMVARSTAQMAADTSSLFASGYAKEKIRKSDGSDAQVLLAFAEAKTRAEALFKAQISRTNMKAYTATVTLTRNTQKPSDIGATTDFSVTTNAMLGNLFGISTLTHSGSTGASASLPTYTDVYMALDVSQSMGLASTSDGAITLFKAVQTAESGGKGCVFGCHIQVSGSKSSRTYQKIAIDNNVPLRVNVLRDSVAKTIDTAQNDGAGSSTYRIGLYTMSLATNASTSSYALKELSPLSGNFTALRTAASGIDLGPNNSGGTGDSYLNEQIQDLAAKIPTPGDGSSQSKAKSYVLIVTDGVRDIAGSCTSGHCIGILDPAKCKILKDRGITVGVIYTTYLPILDDPTKNNIDPKTKQQKLQSDYVNLVVPIASQIAPQLKLCTTGPDWFAEASDGPAIDAALTKMFKQTTGQAALKY